MGLNHDRLEVRSYYNIFKPGYPEWTTESCTPRSASHSNQLRLLYNISNSCNSPSLRLMIGNFKNKTKKIKIKTVISNIIKFDILYNIVGFYSINHM